MATNDDLEKGNAMTAATSEAQPDNKDVEKGHTTAATVEKQNPTAATVEKQNPTKATVSEARPADEVMRPKNTERLQGSFTSIVYGAALPCIPIFIVTAILLGIIFTKRVIPQPGWPELSLPDPTPTHEGVIQLIQDWRKTGGSPAYFVDYNPSTLTTIASWTGKVIPYLTSSIMALVAFFAARRIVEVSKDRESKDLPTPHQLTILIGLLSGSGLGPLKDTIKYRWTTKERLVSPIPNAFAALACVTLIGFLIPIADTWFGAAVQVVTITQLSQHSSPSAFGRGLNSNFCRTTGSYDSQGAWYPCNIDQLSIGSNVHYDLAGAAESCQTMNGVSDINTILNYSDSTQTYFFVAHPGIGTTKDFKSKTLALSTQCEPMTRKCFPNAQTNSRNATVVDSTKFSCTPGFTGDVTSNGALPISGKHLSTTPSVGIGFAQDAQLSRIFGSNTSEVYAPKTNPLFFGAWAIGYPSTSPEEPASLLEDPEVFADQFNDYVWMLNCSASVYDVTYSWVNGSVHNFTGDLAEPGMGSVIAAPFTMGIHMAQLALGLTSTMAGFQVNSEELSMMWSQLFSSYTVAILAGALETQPNDLEQTRNNALGVTRVPMVPLYFLLALKFLYALAAICLALAAFIYTNPSETQSVKERLSIKGLATAYFVDGPTQQQAAVKNVEDLFKEEKEEDKKVGMVQTELGGWQFVSMVADKAWKQVEPLAEKTLLNDANKGTFGKDGKYAAEVYTVLK